VLKVRAVRWVAAIAAALAAAPAATADTPQLVGYGTWTLRDLGAQVRPITAAETGQAPFVTRRISFHLPPAARQGAGSWWRIHLHFTIRIPADSPAGPVYVTASTNGRTAASIRFFVTHSGGRTHVTSDALGLVKGRETSAGTTLARDVVFENFLQYRGIRPGANELELGVERTSPARIDVVTFRHDTALVRGRIGPATFRPELSLPHGGVHAQSPFDLQFRLIQTGGLPQRNATATVHVAAQELRVHGPATLSVPFGANRVAEGRFRLEPLKVGRPRIEVVFTSAGVATTALVAVRVQPAASGDRWWLIALAAAVLVLVAALGVFILKRRRAPAR
jgi:hypothetical protein